MKTKTVTLKLDGDHFDGESLRSLLERAIRITFPTVAKVRGALWAQGSCLVGASRRACNLPGSDSHRRDHGTACGALCRAKRSNAPGAKQRDSMRIASRLRPFNDLTSEKFGTLV